MERNCINCGEAINVNESKCPYCGISYIDMTDIDFESERLVCLKLKCGEFITEMMGTPRMCNMFTTYENSRCYRYNECFRYNANSDLLSENVSVDIGFDVVKILDTSE